MTCLLDLLDKNLQKGKKIAVARDQVPTRITDLLLTFSQFECPFSTEKKTLHIPFQIHSKIIDPDKFCVLKFSIF